jgi:hypothetical protein
MYLLHSIGNLLHPNYNSREQVAQFDSLSFDGVYRNVFLQRDIIRGKDVTLFVVGASIGRDNSFDHGQPHEMFCNWVEIEQLVDGGATLGWHTWTHPDLTTLGYEEILREVTPPRAMSRFAYPFGKFNPIVLAAVKEAGFTEAFSVGVGDGSTFQQRRSYLPFHNARLADEMWGGLQSKGTQRIQL